MNTSYQASSTIFSFKLSSFYLVFAVLLSNFYVLTNFFPWLYKPLIIFFLGFFIFFIIIKNEKVGYLRRLWPFFLFLFVAGLSCFWSMSLDLSLSSLVMPVKNLILSVLIVFLIRTKGLKGIEKIVWITAIVGIIIAFLLYLEAGALRGVRDFYGVNHPQSLGNILGSIHVLMVPLLFYFAYNAKGWQRFLNLFLLVCSLGVVLMSMGRQSVLLLFFIVVGVLFLIDKKSSLKMFGLILFIFFFISAGFIYQNSAMVGVLERFKNTKQDFNFLWIDDIDEVSRRAIVWRAGAELIAEHALTGIGWGAFPEYLEKNYGLRVGEHNLIVAAWGGAGIFGLASFLILIFTSIRNSLFFYIKSIKEKDSQNRLFFSVVLIGLLAGYLQFIVRANWSNSMFFIFLVCSFYSRQLYFINRNSSLL